MLIEMEHKVYTQMMRKTVKEKDYDAAQSLVAKGLANVTDVNAITMRSGEKSTLESNREIIYPTEAYSKCHLPKQPPQNTTPILTQSRRTTPTAFEIRNVGTTLEVEPTQSEKLNILDLRLSYEYVSPESYTLWSERKDAQGTHSITMPHFPSHRVNLGATLFNGQFQLTHTFTGKDSEGNKDPNKKILFFVMAETIPVHQDHK
ncbi:hypothetical protein ACFSW8_17060 [Rubritalea tangerina]|uniref:Uncharacterized protein n=2 Tax=Rubritalea tangerina TaxID=430798 RepID=A0ABW4ZF17_9BACT